MTARRTSLILAAVAALGVAGGALAGDRVALLVANRDDGAGQVPTLSLEKTGMELEALGFVVERREDLDPKELEAALEGFLRSAPTMGIAVVCFSGHGFSKVSGRDQRRTVRLQGRGEAVDERSAERASYELNRAWRDFERFCGAREVHVILEFAEKNPALQENEVPTAAHLQEVEVPEGVSLARSAGPVLAALKERLPKTKRSFLVSRTVKEGASAGQEWVNGLGMVFCWCPPGTFTMGIQSKAGAEHPDARPVEAGLSRGFWIGKYELTQREYRAIRGKDPNRGGVRVHRNAPVTNFGNGAADLARKLTDFETKAGRLPEGWRYVVPTEAEWEYACRAGSTTRYCFGDSLSELDQHANFADRRLYDEDAAYHYALRSADDGFGATLALVGTYRPNAWGIHDMHGNVSEWCRDVYLPTLPGGVDPFPGQEVKNGERVIRGGAWCSTPEYCQSGFRNSAANGNNSEKVSFLGVRLVLKKVDG